MLICVGKMPDGERINMITTVFDKENFGKKPIIVFTHGYAASSALYYQMYKRLMKHFSIVTFDHVGMGASSRPQNYNHETITPQESIDYFVDYVEEWRIQFSRKVMKGVELKDFYLVGHSFGGYVVGNYALKHHDKIKKLILLSPLGLKLTDVAIDESGDTISKNPD